MNVEAGQVWVWHMDREELCEVYLMVADGSRGIRRAILLYSSWRERYVGDDVYCDLDDPSFHETHERLL